MRIGTALTVGVLTALLMSVPYVSAGPSADEMARRSQPVMTLVPCDLPTPDIANRLPWFIKASDVIYMSVTADDLRTSEQARLPLIQAGTRVQNENCCSDMTLEYDHDVVAYAEGRYSDAIYLLHAVMASTN